MKYKRVYYGRKGKGSGAPWWLPVLLFALLGLILLGRVLNAPVPSSLILLATAVLFLVPGMMLINLLPTRSFVGIASLAPAFVLSAGIFGLLGAPALMLHWNIDAYLWLCGGVVLACVIALLLPIFPTRSPDVVGSTADTEPGAGWLWAPFVLLGAVLAFASAKFEHQPSWDIWLYLAHILDFVERDKLAYYLPYVESPAVAFSRLDVNGWLLEQAALSNISGIEPVDLVTTYLAPTLVVVALLAFYSLALALLGNRSAALLSVCLYALFFLFYLSSSPNSVGGEFVGRIAEDKYVARFIFVPVALTLAVLFVRERRLLHLGLFTLVCWSVVLVHPLGLVFIGVPVAGFGLIHLLANLRERGAWLRVLGLGAGLSSVVAAPVAYLGFSLARGGSLPSMPNFDDASRTALQLSASEQKGELLMLGDASYVLAPSLLLQPPVLVAYVVGLPFLLWRVKRRLAAQLLLGVLLIVPLLLYVPPVTTLLGQAIGPWMLYRLAWPLPLVALLTVGWVAWEGLGHISSRLSGLAASRRVGTLLPAILVVALVVIAAPAIADGLRAADTTGEADQEATTCSDPVFSWMRDSLDYPSTVMMRDSESGCLPAYAAEASVVSYRGASLLERQAALERDLRRNIQVPQVTLDVDRFFSSTALDRDMLTILARYEIRYVLLPADSPLEDQLRHASGFMKRDSPGDRYEVYEVDAGNLATTPAIYANGSLNKGSWGAAIDSYDGVLEGTDEDEQFLAYLGRGRAYAGLGEPEAAAESYEQAIALDAKSPNVYALLAEARAEAGDPGAARAALEKAVELKPSNVEVRYELGALLQEAKGAQAALDQYRAVVRRYPEVPGYRVELGRVLMRAERPEAGAVELEKAASLDPLSTKVHTDVGQAYKQAGRLEEALPHYERVRDMSPNNQGAAFRLGMLYSQLSTQGGKDEAYFEKAEDELGRVMELDPPGTGQDLRARAQIALGELYDKWNRPEQAAEAYRRAVQTSPDSPAVRKLRKLHPEL